MKYMGSKRSMLENGLGHLIEQETKGAKRFADLFSGSGAVASHVARHFPIRVLAFDLQRYSAVLTSAIIGRQTIVQMHPTWDAWEERASQLFVTQKIPTAAKITRRIVADFRAWCDDQGSLPITRAYGGHYFSPLQTVWLDAFRHSLPRCEPSKTVALAALIQAASQCAAAPGHTAQPFQPTRTAKRYLVEAWDKDIVAKTRKAFEILRIQFAQRRGNAEIADANEAAEDLREGDLAFIDPPYSGVHYSRFYHVLETIARGGCGDVSGAGRYPAPERRPRSKYSVGSESAAALESLLKTVASRGARAIITFPDHDCSNGLSGRSVRDIAAEHFTVESASVSSRFSTLGGAGKGREKEAGRAARREAKELMLVLKPR